MIQELVCWKCGAPVKDVPLPMSRRAVCRACNAELHVCRMCEYYDPRVAGSCREDRAEDVSEKERANFCDYFKPRPNAYRPRDNEAAKVARAGLDALFGASPTQAEKTAEGDVTRSEADIAREELEKLFGLDQKRKPNE